MKFKTCYNPNLNAQLVAVTSRFCTLHAAIQLETPKNLNGLKGWIMDAFGSCKSRIFGVCRDEKLGEPATCVLLRT